MKLRLLPCIAAVLAASGAACGDSSGPVGTAPLRVLFIGNSLTYTNDLPGMVAAIARASGESIETEMVAEPNFSIEDHWTLSDARSRVRNGNYDVVVLQQGPSALPESREVLRQWALQWAAEIRSFGGRPALYAVWPELARFDAFADVSESYRLAAEAVNGAFFPAGDAWIETWKIQPDAPLYGSDDFHPSITGSYAAAIVITAALFHRDPATLAPLADLPANIRNAVDPVDDDAIRLAAKIVLSTRIGDPQLAVLR